MIRLLSLCAILAASAACAAAENNIGETVLERRYCTQFGSFAVRIDGDKAAGVYAIVTHGHLGAFVGAVSGRAIEGKWMELSNHGDIRMVFVDDWSSFEAQYNTVDDKDNWRIGWKGRVPADTSMNAFEADGVKYLCN